MAIDPTFLTHLVLNTTLKPFKISNIATIDLLDNRLGHVLVYE